MLSNKEGDVDANQFNTVGFLFSTLKQWVDDALVYVTDSTIYLSSLIVDSVLAVSVPLADGFLWIATVINTVVYSTLNYLIESFQICINYIWAVISYIANYIYDVFSYCYGFVLFYFSNDDKAEQVEEKTSFNLVEWLSPYSPLPFILSVYESFTPVEYLYFVYDSITSKAIYTYAVISESTSSSIAWVWSSWIDALSFVGSGFSHVFSETGSYLADGWTNLLLLFSNLNSGVVWFFQSAWETLAFVLASIGQAIMWILLCLSSFFTWVFNNTWDALVFVTSESGQALSSLVAVIGASITSAYSTSTEVSIYLIYLLW